jgi:RNA polymerase sigma-70 factor (ECF subfamily)
MDADVTSGPFRTLIITGTREANTLDTCLDREQKLQEIIAADRIRLFMIASVYERGSYHNDLCKEILLGIWKGLDSHGERAGPGTWVYRIALNIAIDWKSDRPAAASAYAPCHRGTNPRDSSDPKSAVETLYEFMHGLQMLDRAVFLSCLDVFSSREMAEIIELDETKLLARSNRLKSDFSARYIGA